MIVKLTAALTMLFALLFNVEPRNAPYDQEAAQAMSSAIVEATQLPWEMETLARIARWESSLRKEVVNCVVLGKLGERGAFQVIPRSHSEGVDLCSTDLAKQARVALGRVRESKLICERQGLRGADVLGVYTHGRCVRGNRFAALRFGDGSRLTSLIKEQSEQVP